MKAYSLSHLADHALLRELAAVLAQHRGTTATLLAYLAEVDERRLYLPAAHASMYSFCVHELHMSEDVAYKRIRAARAARELPAIFDAVASGRVHLSGVVLLAPRLTPENADELLAAATHKTKAEIELLLAQRFPQPEVPTLVQALAPAGATLELAMGPGEASDVPAASLQVDPSTEPNSSKYIEPLAPD